MSTKTEYREYIASEEWQARRKEFLTTNVYCRRCGMPRKFAILLYDQDLHVHHKSYARVGCEEPEDLEPLCRRCHEVETFQHSNLHDYNFLAWGPLGRTLFIIGEEFKYVITESYAEEALDLLRDISEIDADLLLAEVIRVCHHMPSPRDLQFALMRAQSRKPKTYRPEATMTTYREQFDSAMKCETKEQAEAWLAGEIGRYKTDFGIEPKQARETILVNLGYMAGYCDSSVGDKIFNLFGAAHPIFGRTRPTAPQALQLGKDLAASL